MLKGFKLFLGVCLLILCAASQADEILSNVGVLLKVKGAIGPATQEYVVKGIEHAQKRDASLVILQIDTPGGLSKSMRGIIQAILSSTIPVVTYVAPSGARAASAGTYILYASSIAAMAPGTNLGAATPVNLMGGGKDKKGSKPTALEMKALNDARAYIRSLAQLHGRNVAWAENAVKKAASLSATEALKRNVITNVAANLPALLKQINGKEVKVAGNVVKINTSDLTIVQYQPTWRSNLLAVIANPMIAYIFLIIAFYGLFFEFANPGMIAPGVIGAIALILGLYGLQMLPVNYVGLGLIFLGFFLFVAELFVASFGILGIGGIISFVLGSIFLMDTGVIGFAIPWGLILGFSVATGLYVIVVIQMVVRVRHRPKMSGLDVLIGQTGEVLLDDKKAWLRVNGELWQIDNSAGLNAGDQATVSAVTGMNVTIRRLK